MPELPAQSCGKHLETTADFSATLMAGAGRAPIIFHFVFFENSDFTHTLSTAKVQRSLPPTVGKQRIRFPWLIISRSIPVKRLAVIRLAARIRSSDRRPGLEFTKEDLVALPPGSALQACAPDNQHSQALAQLTIGPTDNQNRLDVFTFGLGFRQGHGFSRAELVVLSRRVLALTGLDSRR